jgi:hypothetical protein
MYLFDITVLKISARVRLRHPKEHWGTALDHPGSTTALEVIP